MRTYCIEFSAKGKAVVPVTALPVVLGEWIVSRDKILEVVRFVLTLPKGMVTRISGDSVDFPMLRIEEIGRV